MQFEDFDKKVREAAEHHHPAYDEKAWDSMEKLLDKHLPVEKDNRRRLFFFLLLFLLAGTGAYLWMAKPWNPSAVAESSRQAIAQPPTSVPGKNNDATNASNNNNIEKSNKETSPVNESSPVKNNTVEYPVDRISDPKNADSESKTTESKTITVADKIIKKETNQYFKKKSSGRNKETFAKAGSFSKIIREQANHLKTTAAETGNNKINNTEKPVANNNTIDNSIDKIAVAPESVNTIIADNPSDKTDKPLTTDSTVNKGAEKENVVKNETPAEQKKLQKKNKSSFAITVSGGPDVSSVGLSSLGKMNCVIGAGLSYTYNRFTLRSGFYAVKKIYTAGPDDYNPPQHYWTNYVNLTKVDANCKVFEIPVTIGYNFVQKPTHSIFGAVGISSFLMKKETYEYYYKNQNGDPQYKSWSTTGNKNLFSVFDLSAGYESELSRGISLTVEPYVKIPLDGVGFGNIKMNSMGVLITMNIKPFARKK